MVMHTYGVFVVRIWLESGSEGTGVWRATVTDTASKEKYYFVEPNALSDFLLAKDVTQPFRARGRRYP